MMVPNWFGAGRSGIGSVVSGRMLSMKCPQAWPRWQERLALVVAGMREVQDLRCRARESGIEYAAASRFQPRCLRNTGSPAFEGADTFMSACAPITQPRIKTA